MLLNISNLGVSFDGLRILEGISLNVQQGQLVSIIGANGAGKSTILRAICGLEKPQTGKIEFNGEDITGLHPKKISDLGLTMVPEGKKLFYEMTAEENLKMGAFRFRKDKARIKRNLDRVYDLFPILREHRGRVSGTFSGGEQQMISIGRGLMCEPKLLMIDELSLGLAPLLVETLFQTIKRLNEEKVSMLLVEQNINQALKVADYGYVIENGNLTIEGEGHALRHDERIISAYFGM